MNDTHESLPIANNKRGHIWQHTPIAVIQMSSLFLKISYSTEVVRSLWSTEGNWNLGNETVFKEGTCSAMELWEKINHFLWCETALSNEVNVSNKCMLTLPPHTHTASSPDNQGTKAHYHYTGKPTGPTRYPAMESSWEAQFTLHHLLSYGFPC